MAMKVSQLTITRPDDWHLHLRNGASLKAVLPFTIKQFGRALIMPNLKPPIKNLIEAWYYKEEIRDAFFKEEDVTFQPLMTIYLTDTTSVMDIKEVKDSGFVIAAKFYPANATTNAENGVTDIKRLAPVFEKMAEVGLPLCIHGETLVSEKFGDVTRGGRVGQLRREAVFLKETLSWIVETFPTLKVILEHITTSEAVDFVLNAREGVGATITAHHLLATLDDALESHHNKCMPILKEEHHRQVLLAAATSGNPRFFAGTDSAPHAKSQKETACGCAGCFTALHAVELYATAFEEMGAINMLEGFLSHFGADFYGIERNQGTLTIEREGWMIPTEVPFGESEILIPFWAGKTLNWKVD